MPDAILGIRADNWKGRQSPKGDFTLRGGGGTGCALDDVFIMLK